MQRTMTNRPAFIALLLAGIVMMSFVSCKKDKSINNGNNPPAATKLKEYRNGDDLVQFTYNTDGTIKKALVKTELNTNGDAVDFNISYNAQKKISEVTTTSGEKIVPEYENGLLTRANIFEGTVRTGYTNYHYETNQLKIATIYVNAGGVDFEPILEFRFSYDGNGNLNKSEIFMSTGVPGQLVRAGHVNFQFDQKTNPLYANRDFLALLWQAASKNNVTKEEHFGANLQLEDVFTYVYTYKTNGLPERATVTNGLPGQPPVISSVNFTYE
ncbi:MAG TPA: hypothetical protein VFI06_06875 [Chitinophagaceae bacterium]|nr:hypothetical protein [Chitinophagaceae bacterium]